MKLHKFEHIVLYHLVAGGNALSTRAMNVLFFDDPLTCKGPRIGALAAWCTLKFVQYFDVF